MVKKRRRVSRRDSRRRVQRKNYEGMGVVGFFVVMIVTGVFYMSPNITGSIVGENAHLGFSAFGIMLTLVGMLGLMLFLKFRNDSR